MKDYLSLVIMVGVTALLSLRLGAQPVKLSDLPPAVQETINTQTGDIKAVASVHRLVRNGITLYEVRFNPPIAGQPLYISQTGSFISGDSVRGQPPATPGKRPVAFRDLPQVVQNTVRGQAGILRIDGVEAETANGKTIYRASFKSGTKPLEVVVDSAGNLLSGGQTKPTIEQRVPLSAASKVVLLDVPAAVQNTIRNYSLGAEIEDIDKGTLQGQTVYEAAFKYKGENIELRVREDGSLVHDEIDDKYLKDIGRSPQAVTESR